MRDWLVSKGLRQGEDRRKGTGLRRRFNSTSSTLTLAPNRPLAGRDYSKQWLRDQIDRLVSEAESQRDQQPEADLEEGQRQWSPGTVRRQAIRRVLLRRR